MIGLAWDQWSGKLCYFIKPIKIIEDPKFYNTKPYVIISHIL